MSKIIVVGDIHGRDLWKKVIGESWDKFVFIGDYFDSFDVDTITQLHNFKEICEFKRGSKKEVVMLIGNHDHHYFPEVGDTGTSGYQRGAKAMNISSLFMTNRELLQMAYSYDNILFTHAGVSTVFMDETLGYHGWELTAEDIAEKINELWQYKPLSFVFNGTESHGDDLCQTPTWIRPHSLMKGSQSLKEAGIIQVVGHTQQYSIDIKGKATGSKYFFIDTLGSSKEYLIYENGKFSTKIIKP